MISELLQHIYMHICTALFSQLTIAFYILASDGTFQYYRMSFLFLVQVLYCPQQSFKETVQHQWTQWSNHYHWTSGPRDSFLAQHNCYSHRNKWVRNVRNAGVLTLWTVIILCMCLLLSGEYILLSDYITVACYTKEHY